MSSLRGPAPSVCLAVSPEGSPSLSLQKLVCRVVSAPRPGGEVVTGLARSPVRLGVYPSLGESTAVLSRTPWTQTMEAALAVARLPPHDPRTPALSVVDMHTGGEPLRIVYAGCPEVAGPTLLAKRRYMRHHLDYVRRRLVFEPRGHRDMYGAVLVPSELPEAHLGVLFLHNEGYSSMCGHGVLALGRFALDFGLVPAPPDGARETQVNIHCPCGLVAAFVACEGGRSCGPVRFHSVPAFVLAADLTVDVPGHGKVVMDIAYGGAFYAFVSAEKLGLDVSSAKMRDLVEAASTVTEAVKAQFKINHPENEDLGFLYGTILTDGKDAYSEEPTTNICVFADEQVDRSPTGSGVTARIALQYHKGLLQLNQTRTFRSSATGSVFTGRAVREVKCGDFKAVIVEVAGQAHYTGTASFTVEDDDPLRDGFLLK